MYNKKNLYKLLGSNQTYYFNKKLEFWYLSSQNSDYKADSYNELTNHLGNVLSIMSDRVLYKQGDDYDPYNKYNDSKNQCWEQNDKISIYPDILDYNDYYPFGSTFEDASKTALAMDYRFGFNGMESDDEVKGDDNNYTTMFRQYDPRLGRLLSTDPLVNKYPSLSPYNSSANNPILFLDQNGDTILIYIDRTSENTIVYTPGMSTNETYTDFVNQTIMALNKLQEAKSIEDKLTSVLEPTNQNLYISHTIYTSIFSPGRYEIGDKHYLSKHSVLYFNLTRALIGTNSENKGDILPLYMVLWLELGHYLQLVEAFKKQEKGVYDKKKIKEYINGAKEYKEDDPNFKYSNLFLWFF